MVISCNRKSLSLFLTLKVRKLEFLMLPMNKLRQVLKISTTYLPLSPLPLVQATSGWSSDFCLPLFYQPSLSSHPITDCLLHSAMHTAHQTLHPTMHTAHYTLNIVHGILPTGHITEHTAHCTLHTSHYRQNTA